MSVPRNRALIPAAFADLSQWPAPDEDVLNEEILRIYRPRKLAVAMYADGVAHEQITAATAIPRQKIFYLVSRCMAGGEDGTIAG